MSANPIVHWELMGPDGDAQKAFYGGLFDWEMSSAEGFDGYHLVSTGEGSIGGAVGKGSEEMPSFVTVYIQVASIDDTMLEIEAAGGSVVTPRTEIPGVVVFGLFTDPAGNVVGLVEEDAPAAGEADARGAG